MLSPTCNNEKTKLKISKERWCAWGSKDSDKNDTG